MILGNFLKDPNSERNRGSGKKKTRHARQPEVRTCRSPQVFGGNLGNLNHVLFVSLEGGFRLFFFCVFFFFGGVRLFGVQIQSSHLRDPTP